MTGEEMERAIEFLIRSQADAGARQERTDRQIAERGKHIQAYLETESQRVNRRVERMGVWK